MVRIAFGELIEEDLQASGVHPRQVKTKALSGGGLHRCVEVGPLVGASHEVGRAKPLRTVAPVCQLISPKRASSKAITFSGFPFSGSGARLCARSRRRSFFEGLLLLGVGLLVAGTSRLELDLAASEELADAIGVGVLDAVALSKELVGLRDGGDLPTLHDLLQILEGLWRDQFLSATLMHPALEQFLKSSHPVAGEPPLALTPGVAQRLGDLPQVEHSSDLRSLSILTRWNR
jgi:hypothetical protein